MFFWFPHFRGLVWKGILIFGYFPVGRCNNSGYECCGRKEGVTGRVACKQMMPKDERTID